jgi:hypothetical protein
MRVLIISVSTGTRLGTRLVGQKAEQLPTTDHTKSIRHQRLERFVPAVLINECEKHDGKVCISSHCVAAQQVQQCLKLPTQLPITISKDCVARLRTMKHRDAAQRCFKERIRSLSMYGILSSPMFSLLISLQVGQVHASY